MFLSSVIDPGPRFYATREIAGTAFGRPPQPAQTACGFLLRHCPSQGGCRRSLPLPSGLYHVSPTRIAAFDCLRVTDSAPPPVPNGRFTVGTPRCKRFQNLWSSPACSCRAACVAAGRKSDGGCRTTATRLRRPSLVPDGRLLPVGAVAGNRQLASCGEETTDGQVDDDGPDGCSRRGYPCRVFSASQWSFHTSSCREL